MKAYLILEDGTVFTGESFGAQKEVISEIEFNTSMTGYLEILTDPSYAGQAVVMTYPLIGNYGICRNDCESTRIWPDGYIVREISRKASNFRNECQVEEILVERGIPGISGIDTRALTKLLRSHGTMNGMITTVDYADKTEVIAKIKEYKVTGVVNKVTCKEKKTTDYEHYVPTDFEKAKLTYMATPDMAKAIKQARSSGICEGEIAMCAAQGTAGIERLRSIAADPALSKEHFKVALYDFGAKRNIEHNLLKRGCTVTVVPANTPAKEIIAAGYDGIMLSNGPGDPAECTDIIKEIKELYDSGIPIFAICLGHQLMALANGFKTEKMKYGHRGANHPVRDLKSGRVYITTQNHGYMVKLDSIDPEIAEARFINANDGTVEGISYKNKKVFTVQFHPEACGGPQDTEILFDEFIKMMEA